MNNRPQSAGINTSINLMEALLTINKIKWANIWCEFNSWRFPKELEELKPDWWDDLGVESMSDRKSELSRPLMKKIESVLGIRWVSREWNKDRMTEFEHNEWWIRNKLDNKQ